MGGFGSGGRRPGAGRKKKPTHLRAIDGGAGRRGESSAPAAVEAPGEPQTLEPPADLSAAELVVWDAWAPLATAAKTLTPGTLGAFVHLVQLEADRRELRGRYTLRRATATGELLPLLVMDSEEELALRREVRTLTKDIKATLKDFCIAPFGKELQTGGAEPEADPLEAFTRRRG